MDFLIVIFSVSPLNIEKSTFCFIAYIYHIQQPEHSVHQSDKNAASLEASAHDFSQRGAQDCSSVPNKCNSLDYQCPSNSLTFLHFVCHFRHYLLQRTVLLLSNGLNNRHSGY
jgi:hypothetical protein